MSRPVFRSMAGNFFRKNDSLMDMIQGHMAQDIDVSLKTTAGMPVKYGQMKGATRHFKNAMGGWRVEIDKEYASPQEKGEIKGRKIRNYTTPGTSSGFFRRAIDGVVRNRSGYVQEARRALGL